MLQASPRCKALIAQFEGCAERLPDGRFRAYPDPASPMGRGQYPKDGKDVSKGAPWTIGFGSTGAGITRGTVWTLAQCERQFDEHIEKFSTGVRRVIGNAPTTQAQFDAMTSFAYNVGVGALEDSTLLRLHKAGDFAGAQKQFARWDKAGGKVLAGLTKRRAAEAALYGSN